MRYRSVRRAAISKRPTLRAKEILALVLPVHVAVSLLPLGLYSQFHSDSLAAFLSVGQIAARNAGSFGLIAVVERGAAAVIAIKRRNTASGEWFATDDEMRALLTAVSTLDKWHKTITFSEYRTAVMTFIQICDRATANGKGNCDVLEDAA